MQVNMTRERDVDVKNAVTCIWKAVDNEKCWKCECLHGSLRALESAFPEDSRPAQLEAALKEARERLGEVGYDCLGCNPCYAAAAINALKVEADTCLIESIENGGGWPPFSGSYTVLHYHAPVAICTLTDDHLRDEICSLAGPEVAIVGTMQTENLGIERLISNILANPNIRFMLLCGADSCQDIGHLPGQSLLALVQGGLDKRSRIIGARGKRPHIRNISKEAVEYFRVTVELIDHIGDSEVSTILEAARYCAKRNPGSAKPFEIKRVVETVPGYLPQKVVLDPAGYFVIFVDRSRKLLSLEHYRKSGVLDVVIEGRSAAELYIPAIEKGLVSLLEHAAYLGQELARAERSLNTEGPYIQDAAPTWIKPARIRSCGCESSCQEAKP